MAMQKFVTIDGATNLPEEAQGTSTGGTGTGGKIVHVDESTERLHPSLMPVGVAAETYVGNAFENLNVATPLVYIKADGTVANASGASGGNYAVGFITQSYTTGQSVTVYFEGSIATTGLTPNQPVFLSDSTAGGMSQTKVTGANKLYQEVGWAITASSVNFTNSGFKAKRV